jgi:hypothetical protein
VMNREQTGYSKTNTFEREEVSTATWIPFFNDFISTYRGRTIVLEEFTSEEQDGRRVMQKLPLQSVATVLGTPGTNSGVDVRGANSMAIGVADRSGKLVTHNIDDVARVYELKRSDGNTVGLEIETGKGTRLEMRFT